MSLPTGLIDLHCDTLTDCNGLGFSENSLNDCRKALALSKIPRGTKWVQCFAVFVPDTLSGSEATSFFVKAADDFDRQMGTFSDRVAACRSFSDIQRAFFEQKFAAVLTAENANFLAGDLGNIQMAAQRGVRMATLVWNGENELGAGVGAQGGLTVFGRAAVAEMERCGILVDVSHLNDEGFWDLCKIAKKPFVASHSNARAVANRPRNLTDAQICEIVRRKGLIGLNFYTNFLRADGWEPSLDDLYRHAVHFLELGAADALALGSDYDGAKTPPDLDSVEKSLRIFSYFLSRGMPEKTADAILFKNAWRFFQRNL